MARTLPGDSTAPAYKLPVNLLSTVEQAGTPGALSRLCVLGEATLGFVSETIGRQNPEYLGEKVYAKLSEHFLQQVQGHAFSKVTDEVRSRILNNPSKHLKRLRKTEGTLDSESGQANSIDCEYAMTLVEQIFVLICGRRQDYADCGLPPTVKSMFLALDRDLVKALLAWRRGQQLFRKEGLKEKLAALKDDKGTLDKEAVATLLKPYGWIAEFYNAMLQHRPITARYINKCRINFFSGIIFNRCISPCLMPQAVPGTAERPSANSVLPKVASAVNKIFQREYRGFIRSFVAYADRFLPEAEAGELRSLEKTEERGDKVGRHKKADGGGDRKLAPRKGHPSAPGLLQGKDFLEAMQKEAVLARHAAQDNDLAVKADSRDKERQWIENFRKKHGDAFKKNPELEWGFSIRLRRWRKTKERLPEAAFNEKLAELYKRAENAAQPAVISSGSKPSGANDADKTERVSSPRASPTGREKTPDGSVNRKKKASRLSMHILRLTDEQSDLLTTFLKNPRRRAFIERFPAMEAKLETAFIEWLNEGTGGNSTLALTEIFEDMALRHFFDAMGLRERTSQDDFKKLETACAAWLKVGGRERPGPEQLLLIWHEKVSSRPAPVYQPTVQVRVAEAIIDNLLRKNAVRQEFANEALRRMFFVTIQPWLNSGAPGNGLKRIVTEFYESALLSCFVQCQPGSPLSSLDLVMLQQAMQKEAQIHPEQIMTTQVLQALLDQLHERGQQS